VWQSGDCQEDIVSSTAGTKAAEVAEAIVKDDEKDQGMFMVRPVMARLVGYIDRCVIDLLQSPVRAIRSPSTL
jgi:hypothetical protein